MRAWVLLAALLAGCAGADPATPSSPAPAPDAVAADAPPGAALPARTDPDREPPVTPRYDGPVPSHRCSISSAFVWATDASFVVPDSGRLAASKRDAWMNSTISVHVESPLGIRVSYQGEPTTAGEALGYRLQRNDSDFLVDLEYGRWYPWTIHGEIESDDPELRGLSLFPEGADERSGYLLRYRGRDDKLHAYLEGELLDATTIAPRIPLPGGELYLSGRGICGG